MCITYTLSYIYIYVCVYARNHCKSMCPPFCWSSTPNEHRFVATTGPILALFSATGLPHLVDGAGFLTFHLQVRDLPSSWGMECKGCMEQFTGNLICIGETNGFSVFPPTNQSIDSKNHKVHKYLRMVTQSEPKLRKGSICIGVWPGSNNF